MCRVVSFLLVAVLTVAPAAAAKLEPLVVGVFPYLTTRTLVNTYQPLRLYLQQSLGREVEVVTAPDLRQFYSRSRRGDYDLVVTPPHFARLHQSQSNLIPLLTYSSPTTGLLITRRDAGIRRADELRGREIAVAEPAALVAIMTRAWLGERGLKPTRDYVFRNSGSHNSALMSVVNRESAAAVLGGSAFRQIAEKFKNEVVVLATVGETMGLVVLAGPRLSGQLSQIEQLLTEFPNTSEGKNFVEINALGGFKRIEAAEFQKLDLYLPETLRWLGEDGHYL